MATPAVRIDLVIGGRGAVDRALASVSATAKQQAAAQAQAAQSAARATADAQIREADRAAQAASRTNRRLALEDARIREEAIKRTAREAEKSARDTARVTAKAQQEATRAAAKAAAEANARISQRRDFYGQVGQGAASGFKKGVGAVVGVAGLATGGLGVGMVQDAVKSQMDLEQRAALLENATGLKKGGPPGKQFDFVRSAKDISNATGVGAGEALGAFEKIAGKAGTAGVNVVKSEMMELSKIAVGAGVNITDLGDVLGTLVNRGVEGKDLVNTVEALVQQGKDGAVEFKDLATLLDASSGALGKFNMQAGKRIAVAGGLSQMARTFGRKSAEEATTSVNDLATDLGGKADIIQALTGAKVVGSKVVGGEKQKILKGGVEVGTDETRAQLRDVTVLLPEIIDRAVKAGNAGKITGQGGIFTGTSVAIVAPLIHAVTKGITKNREGRYELAQEGQKPTLTGKAAAEALLKQFNEAAPEAGASMEAFNNVMRTSSKQNAVAMEQIKNELGESLTGAIKEATPAIKLLAQVTAEVAKDFAASPKTMIAKFIAMTTLLGAAEAGISKVVGAMGQKLLERMFPSLVPQMTVTAGTVNVAGGPGVGAAAGAGTGAGGTASKVGNAMAVAGAGLAGWEVGQAVVGDMDKGLRKQDARATAREANATTLASRLRMGTATQDDVTAAQKLLSDLKGEKDKGVGTRFIEGATAGARGLANGDVTLANIASLMPGVALARGVVEGGLATQQAGNDKNADAAIAELQAALANPKPVTLAPGATMTVTIGNVSDIASAVGKGGGRDPAAQPIVGQ